MVGGFCKATLILVACLTAGAKLRHAGAIQPLVATQEVTRCLSVLRAAAGASRIHGAAGKRTRRPGVRDS